MEAAPDVVGGSESGRYEFAVWLAWDRPELVQVFSDDFTILVEYGTNEEALEQVMRRQRLFAQEVSGTCGVLILIDFASDEDMRSVCVSEPDAPEFTLLAMKIMNCELMSYALGEGLFTDVQIQEIDPTEYREWLARENRVDSRENLNSFAIMLAHG